MPGIRQSQQLRPLLLSCSTAGRLQQLGQGLVQAGLDGNQLGGCRLLVLLAQGKVKVLNLHRAAATRAAGHGQEQGVQTLRQCWCRCGSQLLEAM